MTRQRGGGNLTGRGLKQRVRTARGRRASSTRWLQRQLNDPYVAEAHKQGYRSRAAFKLLELDDRFKLLGPGRRVVDLGAAPGGWTQIAVERTGAADGRTGARVVAVDIQEMAPLAGAEVLHLDLTDAEAPARIQAALDGPADVVLSDMSPRTTGHAKTDQLRIAVLLEAAVDFAVQVLAPGGTFIGKVFQGGVEAALLARMKRDFRRVRHAKPPASRKESAETYVVAEGFRKTARSTD